MLVGGASAPVGPVVEAIQLVVGVIAAVVEPIKLVVGPIELGVGAIAAVVEAGEVVAPGDRRVVTVGTVATVGK